MVRGRDRSDAPAEHRLLLMNTNGGVTIAPGSTLSGDGSYGAVTSSKTPEARRLCADLLRQAVVPFRADAAAVYAVAGDEHGGCRLVLVAAAGTGGLQFPTDDPADGTALEAMRTGRRAARSFESQGSDREVVAVPCSVDGEVAAVLVAQRLAAGRPLSGIEADGSSLLALGLAVERYRVQLVL